MIEYEVLSSSKSGGELNTRIPLELFMLMREASSPEILKVTISPSASEAATDPIDISFSSTLNEPLEENIGPLSFKLLRRTSTSLSYESMPSDTETLI